MVHPPAIPDSMTALVLEEAGEQPVVREEIRPVPVPAPGHVLVKIAAVGFCHHDALIMAGLLRRGVRLPLVLGHEAAGTVAACAEDLGTGWTGTAVSLMPGARGHRTDGAFAEYVVVPWESLVPLPDGTPFTAAALLGCPIGVAVKAVEEVARVRPGETVLVTGATGGLGAHAAQVARAAGATALGVTGSPHKVARLEAAPWLSSVIPDGDVPWDEVVRALTDERGAEVVIDTGAGDLERAVRALAQGGRLVLMGQLSGERASLAPAEAVFREARILGSLGAARVHVDRALALVRDGGVVPLVDRVLPFSADSVLEAQRLLRQRQVVGRVVLSAG